METYTMAMVGLVVMHCAASPNLLSDRPLFDLIRAMANGTLVLPSAITGREVAWAGRRVVAASRMASANVSTAVFIELVDKYMSALSSSNGLKDYGP